MAEIKDIDSLRDIVEKETMFTSEACKFLGITSQRLHQLVQSGKLRPIKSNSGGTLFLRKDIEDRKNEMAQTTVPKGKTVAKLSDSNDIALIHRALNYFTIHLLCNHSFKKATAIYNRISEVVDIEEPIISSVDQLTKVIDISESSITKAYADVQRGFDSLLPDDYIAELDKGDIYPQRLAYTDNAPVFLFMRGNPFIAQLPSVAIVGTRKPSDDGVEKAKALAGLLGKYQIVVASGLAAGIDRAAHEGVLQIKAPTIGVLGTPITKYYPAANSGIQKQIEQEGLIISQFAPSTPVQRWNFPMRNAVMSGICLATVVIEAGETSGALIQADYAIKQKRFVFIPQSAIDNPNLKWPKKYLNRTWASSFSKVSELIEKLKQSSVILPENLTQETLFDRLVTTHHVHRS